MKKSRLLIVFLIGLSMIFLCGAAETQDPGRFGSILDQVDSIGQAMPVSETMEDLESVLNRTADKIDGILNSSVLRYDGEASVMTTGYYVIAHRGYSSAYGDNNEESYIQAGEAGFWGIEGDLRIKSGIYYMSHDKGSPSSSCTFSRYLEICREYGCVAVIDVKSGFQPWELAKAVQLVENMGMLDKTVFQCYKQSYNRQIRDCSPEARIWYLAKGDSYYEDAIKHAQEVGAECVNINAELPNVGEKIAALKQANLMVCAYLLPTADDRATFADYGTDYMMANNP